MPTLYVLLGTRITKDTREKRHHSSREKKLKPMD
jgi:hypothetical protein